MANTQVTSNRQSDPNQIASELEHHEHQLSPKKSQRLVIIIFVFFLIVAAVVIAYYVGTLSRKDTSGIPPTEVPNTQITQQTNDPNLEVFSHDDFSFQYPSDFSIASDLPVFDKAANVITTLVSKKSTYFAPNYNQESIFVINKLDDTKNCLAGDESSQSLGEKVFNGVSFSAISLLDAGVGNRYDLTTYKTVHNQKCYEVAYTVHSSSDWNNVDMDAAQASVNERKKVLEEIMTTFTFSSN
jgi:hypothetical protein